MRTEAQKTKDKIDTIAIWTDKGFSVSQIVKKWNDIVEEYGGEEVLTEDRVKAILEAEAARAATEDTEEVEMNEWPSDDTSPRHKGQHGTGWI